MVKDSLMLLGFFGLLLSPFYPAILTRAKVLGVTKFRSGIHNVHGEDPHVIPGTEMCEDLHLLSPANLLFTACQGDMLSRYSWFPPMDIFTNPASATQGSIVVIDPKSFKAQKLHLTGFEGPFVTHGIDVITGDDPEIVYIFAVNHLPNPWHYQTLIPEQKSPNKTRSQIEVFRHRLGTTTASYVRSIRHPAIHTPNDILATSPTSFYVTNDHHYRTGLMRQLEDVLTQYLGGWSTTIHVDITDLHADPDAGLTVTTALRGLHNNNGLARAHPSRQDEVLIGDAAGGVLIRARRDLSPGASPVLQVLEHIQLLSTMDNPSFYVDPYATPGNNASGYVVAGLVRAMALGADFEFPERGIPSLVWHIRGDGGVERAGPGKAESKNTGSDVGDRHVKWDQRLIFQDDGKQLRSASAAVMVPIDPEMNGGRKQAWLFVTGFVSSAIVATKVDI